MSRLRMGWMGIRIHNIEPGFNKSITLLDIDLGCVMYISRYFVVEYVMYSIQKSNAPPSLVYTALIKIAFEIRDIWRVLQGDPSNIPFIPHSLCLPLFPPGNLARRSSHNSTGMNDTQYNQCQQHWQRVKTILIGLMVRDCGLQTFRVFGETEEDSQLCRLSDLGRCSGQEGVTGKIY